MYKLDRPTSCRKITPKEAEAFLRLNTFEGQRALNPLKARAYSDLMEGGQMRPVDIATAVLPDGTEIMMNGQHVCTAIVIRGQAFPARVDRWVCDTAQDAWRLFATYDSHAARTERQIIKGARGLYEDGRLVSIPLRVLSNCGSALFVLGDGENPQFGAIPANRAVKAQLVADNADEVAWVDQVFREICGTANIESGLLNKVGIVAAMIATRRVSPAEAESFWVPVGTGMMLAADMPEFRLHKALVHATPMIDGKGGGRRVRNWYSLCIAWWNAWATGDKRSSVKLGAMKALPKPLPAKAKKAA